MKLITKEDIDKIKYKAISLTNVTSVSISTKKMKATAYYDWKNDLIVINENILNNLSEDCVIYIIVHEIIHKLTNSRTHGAKFLNKILSIYSMDDIIRYEAEITKFNIIN